MPEMRQKKNNTGAICELTKRRIHLAVNHSMISGKR
jgi:hypothetical protein